MAEEKPAPQATPTKKGGALHTMGITAGVVLVAAVSGLLVFNLVVRPRLQSAAPQPPNPAAPESETEGEGKLPADAVTVSFEESFASVVMAERDIPASILLYQVSFECANAATAALVEKHKARFVSMLRELHSYKTREELNDPLVEESVRKEALRRANSMLKSLQPVPDPSVRIVSVLHGKFFVQDQL